MSRLKVYVSGPISNGDVEQNVRNACKAATELIKLGYAPLVPQLTAYLQSPVASLSAGFSHETWMEVDLPWVEVADVVLRLPGLSRGADREVAHALAKGVPVFTSIEILKQWDGLGFSKKRLKRIPQETTKETGDPRFHQVLKEMGELHDKKQLDYGAEGDPFANVRSSESWGIPAWQGAMIRACDKVKRLQSFAKNGTLANEGVEDSLIDLANYAVIALVLHRESKCVS